MDKSLSNLRELVMDRETWHGSAVHGVTESDMTEWLNWTEPTPLFLPVEFMDGGAWGLQPMGLQRARQLSD